MYVAKKKIENIIQFVCVLLFVLLSKTVYFGLVNEYITLGLLVGVCIIFFSIRKTITKENLNILLLFYFLIILLSLLHYSGLFSEGILLFMGKRLIYLLLACIFVSNTTKKEFKNAYISVICLISTISIVSKIIQILFPFFVTSICSYVSLPQRYIYTFFCTFGRARGLEIRNYGPFWEPGGFQIFIALALICLLSDEFTNKERKVLLFIGTMITTGSTTGYIILIIIFIGYLDYFKQWLNYRNTIIVFVILIIAIIYVVGSGNILNKLVISNENASLRDRIIDFQYGIELVKDHPMIGHGSSTVATSKITNIYYANSNGILSLMFTFGIPFTIIYYLFYFKGLINLLMSYKIQHMVSIVLCLISIHFAEEAYVLAVMYCFLFRFREDVEIKNER